MEKISDKLDLVLNAEAQIAEGPFWDQKNNLLYWIDILGKSINIFDPETAANKSIQLDKLIGAVIPTNEEGKLLAALEDGIYLIDAESSSKKFLVNPDSNDSQSRFNDGKCDAQGRFWVGTMDLEENKSIGSLYCFDREFNLTEKADGIKISNGLSWSLDNGTMYYIDSPTEKVSAFAYDLETGEISNRRTIISFNEEKGVPDGMTIDSQGMLWIAHFGGKRLDQLYITTASVDLSEKEKQEQPFAGGIFRYQAGVEGSAGVRFKL